MRAKFSFIIVSFSLASADLVHALKRVKKWKRGSLFLVIPDIFNRESILVSFRMDTRYKLRVWRSVFFQCWQKSQLFLTVSVNWNPGFYDLNLSSLANGSLEGLCYLMLEFWYLQPKRVLHRSAIRRYGYNYHYRSSFNSFVGWSTRAKDSFNGSLTGATIKQGTFGWLSWKDRKPDKSLEERLAEILHSIA